MTSGGGTSTVQQTVPDWLKPYTTNFLNTAQTTTQGPYNPYTGQQVADMSQGQQSAISGINNLASGTPGLDASDQFLGNTLTGGNGMNQYVAQAAQPAINQATMAYNQATSGDLARFQGANRNSSAYQQEQGLNQDNLAYGLGNATAPLYQQQYNTGINQQLQAASLEPGINQTLQQGYGAQLAANQGVTAQNQSILSNLMQQYQSGVQYPLNQLSNYGNAISSITGAGKNSTTTGPGADPTAQLAGSALSAYMMYALMSA